MEITPTAQGHVTIDGKQVPVYWHVPEGNTEYQGGILLGQKEDGSWAPLYARSKEQYSTVGHGGGETSQQDNWGGAWAHEKVGANPVDWSHQGGLQGDNYEFSFSAPDPAAAGWKYQAADPSAQFRATDQDPSGGAQQAGWYREVQKQVQTGEDFYGNPTYGMQTVREYGNPYEGWGYAHGQTFGQNPESTFDSFWSDFGPIIMAVGGGIYGPQLSAAAGGGVAGGAAVGGTLGGINAAATGEDIFEGALEGAALGGAAAGVGSALGDGSVPAGTPVPQEPFQHLDPIGPVGGFTGTSIESLGSLAGGVGLDSTPNLDAGMADVLGLSTPADIATVEASLAGGDAAVEGMDATGLAPETGSLAEKTTGVSTDPRKILLADSGQSMTDVGAGLAGEQLGSAAGEGMLPGETGAMDMGQFAPQDVGLVPSSQQSMGLIDSVMGWAKQNPQLASAGLMVGGGLLKGAGDNAAARDITAQKIAGDKDLLNQKFENEKALEEWKRKFIQGASYFDSRIPFRRPSAPRPLTRPDGSPVYDAGGGIIQGAMRGRV